MDEDYWFYYHGEPFTGIGERYYKGLLLRETTYEGGARHGRERCWYPETTQLCYERYYQQNAVAGIAQDWYENGQRKFLKWIQEGILVKGVCWSQWGEIYSVYEVTEQEFPLQVRQLRSKGLLGKAADRAGATADELELDEIIAANPHLLGGWPY